MRYLVIIEFCKRNWVGVLLFAAILVISPIVFQIFHTYYYCGSYIPTECKVWSSGLELLNYPLGLMFAGYSVAFIYKRRISKILLLLFPIVIVIYALIWYIAFLSYVKVTTTNVEFRDVTNRVTRKVISNNEISNLIITSGTVEGMTYYGTYIHDTNGNIYGLGFGTQPFEYISKIYNIPIYFSSE